jgi:hypothetical protein
MGGGGGTGVDNVANKSLVGSSTIQAWLDIPAIPFDHPSDRTYQA